MDKKVKSGNEILEEFFTDISNIQNIDNALSESLANLYRQGKLTDTNLKNELQRLRDKDVNKN
jgi:hypothetical protein